MRINTDNKIYPWIVWGLCACFYFYEYMLQVSPDVMVPQLMFSFDVNAFSLGNLTAFYFYAYAAMQIPVGIMLDNLCPRKVLSCAALVCALGSYLFGSAHSLAAAEFSRFCMGLGSAFAVIGSFKMATLWFPSNKFALLVGLTLSIGMAGASGGQAPLAYLISIMGWRHAMYLLGTIGIILSVLMWFVIKRSPREASLTPSSQALTISSAIKGLKFIIRNPKIWLIAIYGGLMFTPTTSLGALWGASFIQKLYHIGPANAGLMISLIFLGWIVGGPLFGWYSDTIGRRLPPLRISSIFACLTLSVIVFVPIPMALMAILLLLFGFFNSAFLPSFSISKELSPLYAAATALAFMNMLNMVGGAIGQPLIGFLLDTAHGPSSHGVQHFTVMDFRLALSILPICVFLSLLLLPFIKETYARNQFGDNSQSGDTTQPSSNTQE